MSLRWGGAERAEMLTRRAAYLDFSLSLSAGVKGGGGGARRSGEVYITGRSESEIAGGGRRAREGAREKAMTIVFSINDFH